MSIGVGTLDIAKAFPSVQFSILWGRLYWGRLYDLGLRGTGLAIIVALFQFNVVRLGGLPGGGYTDPQTYPLRPGFKTRTFGFKTFQTAVPIRLA